MSWPGRAFSSFVVSVEQAAISYGEVCLRPADLPIRAAAERESAGAGVELHHRLSELGVHLIAIHPTRMKFRTSGCSIAAASPRRGYEPK